MLKPIATGFTAFDDDDAADLLTRRAALYNVRKSLCDPDPDATRAAAV